MKRYARIKAMNGQHKLQWLCEALMVSRSGYYHWLRRQQHPSPRNKQNQQLVQQIHHEFERSGRNYGSPRIAHILRGQASRNRIARLMRQHHLYARQRSKYRVQTTDSKHAGPIAPNLLLNRKAPTRPNQIWTTDATAILTGEGWLYLVALLDLHSRAIVGWSMHHILDAPLTTRALQMAIQSRHPKPGLIVHSDRGAQFASKLYRDTLAQHQLIPSMSRKANCYDNAHIESFWSSLKYELAYHQRFQTRTQAKTAIFQYIESFYNRTRLHSSLNYMSPLHFEALTKHKHQPYISNHP